MKRGSTVGLELAAKERHQECERRANQAIDQLKKKGVKVTFVNVAKASGVSRATLYNIASVQERIKSLKALECKDDSDIKRFSSEEQRSREKQLRDEIELLRKQRKQLVLQLIDQKELLQENLKLRQIIEKQKEQLRVRHF